MARTEEGYLVGIVLITAMVVGAVPRGIELGSAGTTSEAQDGPRVLLRLAADSGVVGHYRFQVQEVHRLAYDVTADDPRAAILSTATGPWDRNTDIALTMVVNPAAPVDMPEYLIYWLGYRVTGDETRSLTPAQWDSIFQVTGRRAVLRFGRLGEPVGVEVSADAVRPVGEALATMLAAAPLSLPPDSVNEGSTWEGFARVPVRRPDGTRVAVRVRLEYRLRRISDEPDARFARIEFDGRPLELVDGDSGVEGRYFGEAVFAVHAGRYEQLTATAELEVAWPASEGGLPSSRSQTTWQARFIRT